jgi:hypothetical protein
MTDKINEKVINIFDKHSKKKAPATEEEKVYTSPDGFNYVHIQYEESGVPLDEKKLLEKADQQTYIVKVLEHHSEHPSIRNFKVTGDRLLEFLESFMSEKRPGKIIEIDKFYPDELA